mmetsp:Transcript_54069/g.105793  ORF Transcript_54069/g.105793 Transcript_54069/m.105793 type:complete len:316 (-) Transcript_54069:204-1151(-)
MKENLKRSSGVFCVILKTIRLFRVDFLPQLSERVVFRNILKQQLQQELPPTNAMLGDLGDLSDRALGKAFRDGLRRAVIAIGDTGQEQRGLSLPPCAACIDQRAACHHAHQIDVGTRLHVVQAVDDEVEALEELDVVRRICDHVAHVRFDFAVRVELFHGRSSTLGLGLVHISASEEELTVQVRHIDRVEVNDVNLAGTGKNQILQKLTPNAPSANHKDAEFLELLEQRRRENSAKNCVPPTRTLFVCDFHGHIHHCTIFSNCVRTRGRARLSSGIGDLNLLSHLTAFMLLGNSFTPVSCTNCCGHVPTGFGTLL